MAFRIGGSVGKFWEENKGNIAKAGSAALGLIPGVGVPLAIAAGALTSGVQNRKKPSAEEQANATEMADLQKQRTEGLGTLKNQWDNQQSSTIANDPLSKVQYSAPASKPRNTTQLDKAEAMQRPSGAIANDAMEELRANGKFDYADRAPENWTGDVLGEIKNFRSGAGDLGQQFATGGYSGAGATAGAASTRDVAAMTERAKVDELMNFDPSAAFEKYVTGAQGQFNTTLGKANDRLTATSAGGNRLNTGFFDLDRGELGRQLSGDARDAMMAKALDTNQQRLSAITSGSQMRADDLNALRDQYLRGEISNADRAERSGTANADRATQASIANSKTDADFRLGGLNALNVAEQQRLTALDKARGYQVGDVERAGKNFETDRTFEQDAFDKWNDTLGKVSTTQRIDRDFDNTNFDNDRGFALDADRQRNDYYDTDEDRALARWGAENETAFAGSESVRGDRDFDENRRIDNRNAYLDFLSGNSDRAQAGQNAIRADARSGSNSTNSMLGTALGAYLGNRGGNSGYRAPTLDPVVNLPGGGPYGGTATPGGGYTPPIVDPNQVRRPRPAVNYQW